VIVTPAGTRVSTREDLIAHLTREWNPFVTYLDRLSDDQWLQPTDDVGWSVRDHVVHVTAWDRAVIDRLARGVPMRETLGCSAAAWEARDYDAINETVRQRSPGHSIARVRSDLDATWTALIETIRALSDEALAAPANQSGINVDPATPGSLLEELPDYVGSHYPEHLSFIQRIVGDS
jgi:hypothetical protein